MVVSEFWPWLGLQELSDGCFVVFVEGGHVSEALVGEVGRHLAVVHYRTDVQLHVPLLDAFDGHCAQGCEVLGEADCDHHLCELLGAGTSHYLQALFVEAVLCDGSANCTDCDRELKRAC